MIPFLAGCTMRVYVAIFGGHAARLHLTRILSARSVMEAIEEGIAEGDDSDDDGEADQPMPRSDILPVLQLRRHPRRAPLLPDWSRVASAAWAKDGDA